MKRPAAGMNVPPQIRKAKMPAADDPLSLKELEEKDEEDDEDDEDVDGEAVDVDEEDEENEEEEKEEDEENGEREDDSTEDDQSTDWETIPEGLCEFAERMLPSAGLLRFGEALD